MALKGKRVILLGAGGAARAIGFGLKQKGCQLTILNRSQNRGEALSKELGCDYLPISALVRMRTGELKADVMINATSLGMYPRERGSPIPKKLLKKEMMVMDIVYQPLQTRLLRDAEEKGCLTINGLEMLLLQAVAQFEIWTGRRPDLRQMRNDLCKALKKEAVDKQPNSNNQISTKFQ
jgi:shikimate dehydrogenase